MPGPWTSHLPWPPRASQGEDDADFGNDRQLVPIAKTCLPTVDYKKGIMGVLGEYPNFPWSSYHSEQGSEDAQHSVLLEHHVHHIFLSPCVLPMYMCV